MRAPCPPAVWTLSLLVLAASAHADAGAVILREERGAFVVTLLAGPVPLRVGPVEFELLVQSRATGAPVLSRTATLRLEEPGQGERMESVAKPGVGGNRLLQGTRVALGRSGTWSVELRVVDPSGGVETFQTRVDVAPPQGPAQRYWVYIAAAPAGLALLALHQALSLAMPGARSPGARRTPRLPDPG